MDEEPLWVPRAPLVDPELHDALLQVQRMIPSTVRLADIGRLRDMIERTTPSLAVLRDKFDVDQLSVSAPEHERVPLLVFRAPAAESPAPVLLFIHGGGTVMGSEYDVLPYLSDLADGGRRVVISVGYRLAPEHPYPAAIEDCYAALQWVAANAGTLGVDVGRLVVVGTSAGGGLAAALCLMTRDRHGPRVAGQMLFSPMLDDRAETPSSQELSGVAVWDRESNAMAWRALLGEAVGGPQVSPYASPSRASDLTGLPPMYLDVGSVETFRDEGVDFAVRLWQSGGDAELHVWPGCFHAFDMYAPRARVTRAAREVRRAWLQRLLASSA